MAVTLCVLLWARLGKDVELAAYEDAVLALLPDHGGRLLQRVRPVGGRDEPTEVQLLQFPSEAALDAFMADERRTALDRRARRGRRPHRGAAGQRGGLRWASTVAARASCSAGVVTRLRTKSSVRRTSA